MSRDRAAWLLGKEQGSHRTGAHATRTDVQGIWVALLVPDTWPVLLVRRDRAG